MRFAKEVRVRDMQCAWSLRVGRATLRQLCQYTAVDRVSAVAALGTQLLQLMFELTKLIDSLLDMSKMSIEELVHFLAFSLWGIQERQQQANLIERHLQKPAVSDEGQALHVSRIIYTIIGTTAIRFG
jgi:hypothetical protein